ncbi:hypothetical protein [Roseiconus lacunae]|uniref:Uncharacterized protein n=1 Tax=Roseiconus lacunae TaxID=2605694 RepID=A0ABT7PHL2_9BACT|nr:hypothetical protein [Roseiconus lacunae]MDM4015992.1 hypothetical protein [Roseiconus lacunae]
MAKRKQYSLVIGFQQIVGPLSKLQAIQRAAVGCRTVRLEQSPAGDGEWINVIDADDVVCDVKTLGRETMTDEQYRRESIPKITSQPLGKDPL